jgi:hypothetical protein
MAAAPACCRLQRDSPHRRFPSALLGGPAETARRPLRGDVIYPAQVVLSGLTPGHACPERPRRGAAPRRASPIRKPFLNMDLYA